MRFETRSPFIIFHDSLPGSHATMFSPSGQKLPFCSDESVFSDARLSYSWAFEGTVRDGESVVFATADREVVGRVRGLDVVAEIPENGSVLRDEENKPLGIIGELLPAMEVLLEADSPHLRSRPRPIVMARPRRW